MTKDYLIEDVLREGLTLVFCGTALGKESLRQRAYYAKSGNQFWPTLHRVGLTERQLAPKEYPEMLKLGFGLTDLCKHHSGQDDELPDDALDGSALEEKILRFQPKWLAFTSKNAASGYLGRRVGRIDYGLQKEKIGQTKLFVLSSPSGLARRWWREDVWQELAERVKNEC